MEEGQDSGSPTDKELTAESQPLVGTSTTQDSDENEKRLRTLSMKAEQQFRKTVTAFSAMFSSITTRIDELLAVDLSATDPSRAHQVRTNIRESLQEYIELSDKLLDYLTRERSQSSVEAKSSHLSDRIPLEARVHQTLKFNTVDIETKSKAPSYSSKSKTQMERKEKSPRRSNKSSNASSHYSSLTSSSVLRQRLKVAATKAQLEFELKEAELRKEKARLEEEELRAQAAAARKRSELQVDLDVLTVKKEAALAATELKVLESEDGLSERSESDKSSVDREAVNERTRQYIENQNSLNETSPPVACANVKTGSEIDDGPKISLNPYTAPFHPSHLAADSKTHSLDIAKFLMKKDLIISRLTQFDDRPENYISWKASFQAIMEEVDANPSEELDLLVKWLGPKSSRHAKSLRASIAGKPHIGRQELWQRLDEQYSCPEVIESALKTHSEGP